MESKRAELIFIPSPGLSHLLVSTVETAKLLLHHHPRLAVTPKPSDDAKTAAFIQNTSSSHSSRLKFINLSPKQPLNHIFFDTIDNQDSNIRDTVSNLIQNSPNSQFAGFVLDIFGTKFIDVAVEFGQDISRFKNSGDEIPVPATVFPEVFLDENLGQDVFFDHIRRISEVKGIMVNTFYEMESYAIEALLSDEKLPDVYPVGPVLAETGRVIRWAPHVESVWSVVHTTTFPLYVEQQLNAFFLVRELGVAEAEAIVIGYKMDLTGERPSEVIEEAIRRLMVGEGVRGRVEEMRRKARSALVEGGSSYNAQRLFVEEVMRNIG
ncbi:hypothetical protein SASPL_129958 [Salvia splendens]|uniref:Uncharacterized protein n=1 Tax=Salvia splendens TaxID=180675 RepID=A0A8X8ZJK4_SALSN|nr:hypothetical protein SASPL_129958 [Salvia splendens]